MTKGELIAALQGVLMKLSAECPLILETDSGYLWVKGIRYEPGLGREGFGAIVMIVESEEQADDNK